MSNLALIATRKEVEKAEKIKKDFGIKNNSDLIRKLLFACPSKKFLNDLYKDPSTTNDIKQRAFQMLFVLSGVNAAETIEENEEKEIEDYDDW